MGAIHVNKKGEKPTSSPRNAKSVEVHINLPPLPKLAFPAWFSHTLHSQRTIRKALLFLILLTLLVLSGIGIYSLTTRRPSSPYTVKSSTASSTVEQIQTTPDYATLLPAGKTIESLGGWTRVSPPDKNPVFAFSDKMNTIPINVSEQPLPDSFKTDTSQQIADLAKWTQATERVTAGDIIFYVANSTKGPQSVIFTKQGLLFMIRSSVKIANDQWISYVKSLQ